MKICSTCHKNLPLDAFPRQRKNSEARRKECSKCTYQVYHKPKRQSKEELEKRKIQAAKVRDRNRDFIKTFLKSQCCSDCGESDWVVLEFDHIDSKTKNISDLITNASIARLSDEIKNCEVVCRNCHIRRTYRRLGTKCYRK